MTTTLQGTLFGDLEPTTSTTGARVTKLQTSHTRPPRRDKEWNELTPCAPTCLACGQPEPADDAPAWPLCPATRSRCATICTHTSDAYRADICLTTTHVHAQLATLPETGLTVAAVTCPYCDATHAHDATPGRHHRISRCHTGRQPYIVHVPEPASGVRSAESASEPIRVSGHQDNLAKPSTAP
ncbi:hypothetical protein [Nonomuraea sp. NPDC050643]|uniref:hypothetical protein n=1 Tax=Nonomuraea sp. NPDC050643 TaxID=3155660 RepID=UPI0033FAADFF